MAVFKKFKWWLICKLKDDHVIVFDPKRSHSNTIAMSVDDFWSEKEIRKAIELCLENINYTIPKAYQDNNLISIYRTHKELIRWEYEPLIKEKTIIGGRNVKERWHCSGPTFWLNETASMYYSLTDKFRLLYGELN